MRVLVYEWCCSGGLTGPDAAPLVPAAASPADLESLAREGRAMFLEVLRDGCRAPGLDMHAVVDATRPVAVPAGVQVHPVAAGDECDSLVAVAKACDIALLIAPETEGLLARRVAAVRAAGVDVIAPGPRFIDLASDKQATILALAAAGIPVPAGRELAAGESWPTGFRRPAVGKRLDGVGCDGLIRVGNHAASPPAAGFPLRIEAAVDGLPVGVACLCRSGRTMTLPPMIQLFSTRNAPGYIGGEPLTSPSLHHRAISLAVRSMAALERAAGDKARGWVGVDMILGPRDDGRGDRVLEVNPRLTTSFLGHAAGCERSLLAELVAPPGNAPPIHVTPRPFDLATHAHS